jgi:hypothetical protein
VYFVQAQFKFPSLCKCYCVEENSSCTPTHTPHTRASALAGSENRTPN